MEVSCGDGRCLNKVSNGATLCSGCLFLGRSFLKHSSCSLELFDIFGLSWNYMLFLVRRKEVQIDSDFRNVTPGLKEQVTILDLQESKILVV